MAETRADRIRAVDEIEPEQAFLQKRLVEIERDMGRVAADVGRAIDLTQPLDALDRARELVAELDKQVLVRPLDEAIAKRIEWLDRAEERRSGDASPALPTLDKIELDRRILRDVLTDWSSRT